VGSQLQDMTFFLLGKDSPKLVKQGFGWEPNQTKYDEEKSVYRYQASNHSISTHRQMY
jgi:hypothetical protein